MAPPQTGSAPKRYRVAAQAANHEEDQMRIVSQASAVLLLGLAMLAGCADRPTGPVPAVQLAGDWAIDVASWSRVRYRRSELGRRPRPSGVERPRTTRSVARRDQLREPEIGRASCRERV